VFWTSFCGRSSLFLLRCRGRVCQKMDPKSVPHMAQFLLPRFAFAAAAVQMWSRFLGMRVAPWLLLLKQRKNSLSAFDLQQGLTHCSARVLLMRRLVTRSLSGLLAQRRCRQRRAASLC